VTLAVATKRFFARIASPYPVASIAALALVNGADSLIEPGPLSAHYVASVIGLVLGIGVLHGLAWQGLFALLRKAPRTLARAAWWLACLGAGAFLASRLIGFSQLHGQYKSLAWMVLAACSAGTLVLAALLSSLQPSAAGASWLQARSSKTRLLCALTMVVVALSLSLADRLYYVSLYLDAHSALRLYSVWLLMFAFVLCDPELPAPRLSLGSVLVIVFATYVPLARLDERAQSSLQAFTMRSWPSLLLELARTLTDVDFDGESALLGAGDCAAFDPRRHPSAREIPDNGLDDNCMLGDAKRRVERVDQLPLPKEPSPMDVVLITIDALRPDHMGVYDAAGYGPKGRHTTPNLDRFAQGSTVFDHAYSAGGWTSISVPTFMRGLYGRRLRWTRYYETSRFAILRKPIEPKLRPGEWAARSFLFAYDDPHPSLAQQLQRRGMYTAAIVDDGVSEILRTGVNVDLGFDVFHQMDEQPVRVHDDAGTTNVALSTLRQMPIDRRFFMWVHYFGVHAPDQKHADVPVYGSTAVDGYDHEIAFVDRELDRLLTVLAQRKNTAVFITADHGEAFYGRIRLHGQTLNEDVIRVPLIARVPGWPAARVQGLASLVDLAPTILALTRTPQPSHLDGEDLSSSTRPAVAPRRRILLTDTWRYGLRGQMEIDQVAAFDGQSKVVLDRITQQLSAYDSTRLEAPPTPVDRFGNPLSRAIFGYLDETGGDLEPQD
jgi:arylsulfatase A-like enzyme